MNPETCEKCGDTITTGLMAVWCSHAEQCAFWPDDPDLQQQVSDMRHIVLWQVESFGPKEITIGTETVNLKRLAMQINVVVGARNQLHDKQAIEIELANRLAELVDANKLGLRIVCVTHTAPA